jgi:PBP1b-binding outer membrane lipoprotein LpoB
MNKKEKVISSMLLGFTLTGCAGTKAEENHSKQKQAAAYKIQTATSTRVAVMIYVSYSI